MGYFFCEYVYDYGAESCGASSDWIFPDVSSDLILVEAFIDFVKLEIIRAYGQQGVYGEYAISASGVPLEFVLLTISLGDVEEAEPLTIDLYDHIRSYQQLLASVSS